VDWSAQLSDALVEAAPDAIVVSGVDGQIVLANSRARQMFGYDRDELVGQPVKILVSDEVGRRRDGTEFPTDTARSTITADDGSVFVVAIIRDDSARREAVRAQALLASIVQSSHDAIVSTDLDGTILTWNPGAERLYGHLAADVLGRSVEVMIPPERRVDEAEIRMTVGAGGRVDRYRSTRLHLGGATVAVSLLVSPLRGPSGKIVGVTTTGRDVSDRERAEAQVQAVLDAAPDALLGVDHSGRVVLVNSQAERLFGFARHEMMGTPVHRLLPEGLPDASADGQRRTARQRDGAELPVEISLSVLRIDSGLTVLVAIRDITERLIAQAESRRLRDEAQRQKLEVRLQRTQRLESLGQLAGGVAHDFNNLLAVILNYAAFIIEDVPGTPAAADAEQIARAGKRGSELTHQLLAFARREVIRPRVLDINVVIGEVEQMLRRSIGEHLTLTTSLGADLPPVLADPGQLEQVLVNLAVNARDAMPVGGRLTIDTATVTVDTESTAGLDSGGYVRLRVSDTGMGMPPEVRDQAFDPFFTTKPSGEGTGLGLATVYGIIAQAGGTVQIYSEPGIGTTITILLPATEENPHRDATPIADDDFPGHGQTILLVEDEPALRQVTDRILQRGGYTVLVAANGLEALRIIHTHAGEIPVLLTDVVMPGMLGKELGQHVTRLRPATRVLYMSGYAQPVLAGQGTLEPGVHLLEKPFTGTELLAAIHHQLNRSDQPST
jgi:two-component system cell cycle sensor histidine kinase/response regulator CckA